jgi:homoserine dehydrogenase
MSGAQTASPRDIERRRDMSADHPPNRFTPEVLRVGLLGCGTVGSPVAKALFEEGDRLSRAAGVRFELARVAVRHPDKKRSVQLPTEIVTTDALAVAIDPEIDVVVEVIGGIEAAQTAIKGALGDNKIVITANKELLAGPGAHLVDDPDMYFEAAVCGGIPIVRALRESCAGDRVDAFTGVLSGTCNYVLYRMAKTGCSLDEAIAKAEHLGYAEADPRADIEGFDAAAKVAILAHIAFVTAVTIADVSCTGIAAIDGERVAAARAEGRVYRLVSHGRRVGSSLELWVRPELLSTDHPLSRVRGPRNAVFVSAARAGTLSFHGAGAGGDPTAAAILGDLVSAVRRRSASGSNLPCIA